MKIKTLLWASNGLMLAFIMALVALAYSTVYHETVPAIEAARDDANTINLAGRQRMLTQKLSKEIELANNGKTEALELVRATKDEFDGVLKGLVRGDRERGLASPGNPEIEKDLLATQELWMKFSPHIENLLLQIDASKSAVQDLKMKQRGFERGMAAVSRVLDGAGGVAAAEPLLKVLSRDSDELAGYLEEFLQGSSSESSAKDARVVSERIAEGASSLFALLGNEQQLSKSSSAIEGLKSRAAAYDESARECVTVLLSKNRSMDYVRANNIPLLKQMNAAVGAWTLFSQERVSAMVADSKAAFNVQLGLGGVSLLLGILVSLYIFRRINKSITALSLGIDKLAEGDLTGEVTVYHRDELGIVSEELNETIVKWRGIVSSLVDTSTTLSASSEELATISSELASGSEQVGAQSNMVASAGEQLSSTLNNMSSSAQVMNSTAGSIAAAIEELNASINEVARNCSDETKIAADAAVKTLEAKGLMDELGNCAQSVDQVVAMVSRISEHTNLLALNATIEAASAGAAGKGFAVVAGEVKKLANEAAASNHAIAEQMKKIQDYANRSVISIESVNRTIEEVNVISQSIAAAIEQQTATTREIARSVSKSSEQVREVSMAVEESSSGAREVSSNIAQVSEAAKQTADAANQTRGSSDELSQMAQKLSLMVGEFKI